VVVVASQPEPEAAAQTWLNQILANKSDRGEVAELLLQAWWCLMENKSFTDNLPSEAERRDGWRKAVNGRTVEIGWLTRKSPRQTRFEILDVKTAGVMNRIVGLETEYGCLTNDPSGPPSAVGRVRNWIFEKNRFGLADMHQRDWDEPAATVVFCSMAAGPTLTWGIWNIARPNASLIDLLRYDRAGDAILLQAVKEMHLADQVSFIRNNVDHYSGATFGCHENYLVRRSAPLTEANVLALLSFLTLRLLYAGSGRVGSTPGAELRGDLM